MKQLTIIGSTGSIGQNTLNVVQHLGERFGVFALAAHNAVDRLAEQVALVRPRVVTLTNKNKLDDFNRCCRERGIRTPETLIGEDGLRAISSAAEVDIVVSGAVGAAGLLPTWSAVQAGKTVA